MTVTIDAGKLRQVATLAEATTPIADGDGAYGQSFVALDPETWRCAIEPASASSAERHFAGTVIAQATHIMRGRFHSGITENTRIQWTDRAGRAHLANVIAVVDSEGAGVQTVVAAVEITNAVPPVDTSWIQGGWIQ